MLQLNSARKTKVSSYKCGVKKIKLSRSLADVTTNTENGERAKENRERINRKGKPGNGSLGTSVQR